MDHEYQLPWQLSLPQIHGGTGSSPSLSIMDRDIWMDEGIYIPLLSMLSAAERLPCFVSGIGSACVAAGTDSINMKWYEILRLTCQSVWMVCVCVCACVHMCVCNMCAAACVNTCVCMYTSLRVCICITICCDIESCIHFDAHLECMWCARGHCMLVCTVCLVTWAPPPPLLVTRCTATTLVGYTVHRHHPCWLHGAPPPPLLVTRCTATTLVGYTVHHHHPCWLHGAPPPPLLVTQCTTTTLVGYMVHQHHPHFGPCFCMVCHQF